MLVFGAVSFFHSRVRDSLTRTSLLLEIKRVQIARIRLDWDRIPAADLATSIAGHPFESDLDITGERSLHRLIDCAVTKEGSDELKSWLLRVRPDAELIERRQSLVRELKHHSLFRDKLQLLSAMARLKTSGPVRPEILAKHWNSRILVEWVERAERKSSLLPTVVFLFVLSGLHLTSIVLSILGVIPPIWPIFFLIYVGAMIMLQSRIATAWHDLQELEKTLTHFKVVFGYLESRSYTSTPGLAQICSPFLIKGKRPSNEIRRLGRLAAALGLRTNPICGCWPTC